MADQPNRVLRSRLRAHLCHDRRREPLGERAWQRIAGQLVREHQRGFRGLPVDADRLALLITVQVSVMVPGAPMNPNEEPGVDPNLATEGPTDPVHSFVPRWLASLPAVRAGHPLAPA